MTDVPQNQRASVLEEIRLIIVEALRNNDVINPVTLASIVAHSYPGSGLTEAQIAAGITEAAAEAVVRVRPSPGDVLGQ